jgi:hypothetical protein
MSPLPSPTRDEVLAFWDAMARKYGSRTVAKATAIEMRVVGRFLQGVGVVDAEAFQTRFTTVIGRRIYAPFQPGDASSGEARWRQLCVCVHEHQHIVQLQRDGRVRFSTRYALQRAARTEYEIEAYTCDLEMAFWRTGRVPGTAPFAKLFEHYGVGPKYIAHAHAVLAANAERVAAGERVTEAATVACAWLDAHTPHLSAVAPGR